TKRKEHTVNLLTPCPSQCSITAIIAKFRKELRHFLRPTACHGLSMFSKTFKTPLFAAIFIALTPSPRSNSSLTRSSTRTSLDAKRSIAGWNRPHLDPTIVISSTTTRDASQLGVPWNVDFKTILPLERTKSRAVANPVSEPLASTTTSNL